MHLSLPAVVLFLWVSALTVVAGLPFVRPPVPTWNAQQARCEDALERRRIALQGILYPEKVMKVSVSGSNNLSLVAYDHLSSAQADVDTYCR